MGISGPEKIPYTCSCLIVYIILEVIGNFLLVEFNIDIKSHMVSSVAFWSKIYWGAENYLLIPRVADPKNYSEP